MACRPAWRGMKSGVPSDADDRSTMSETDPTGYRESPDTTGDAPGGGSPEDVTLTTDDDAQRDDVLIRPGNLPD